VKIFAEIREAKRGQALWKGRPASGNETRGLLTQRKEQEKGGCFLGIQGGIILRCGGGGRGEKGRQDARTRLLIVEKKTFRSGGEEPNPGLSVTLTRQSRVHSNQPEPVKSGVGGGMTWGRNLYSDRNRLTERQGAQKREERGIHYETAGQ